MNPSYDHYVFLFTWAWRPLGEFALSFSASIWRSFCFIPIWNRKKLGKFFILTANQTAPFWTTHASTAPRWQFWQEGCGDAARVCVPVCSHVCWLPDLYPSSWSIPFCPFSSLPPLLSLGALPWFHSQAQPSFSPPWIAPSSAVCFLAACYRAVAFLQQSLLCPPLTCPCQFPPFPATTLSAAPARWGRRWQTVTFSNTLSSTDYS